MANTKDLIKPQRKRGRFTRLEYPFPVPEQRVDDETKWFYYEGFLRGNSIIVENIGELNFLYRMGFFGKGILSRSKPEHEKFSDISQLAFSNSERLRRLPPHERRIRQSKFRKFRKERYKQHWKWSSLMKNDVLNVQNEDAFLYHEEDPETDEDHEDIERIEKCNDDDADDVRIDDVLREIINKRSDDTQDVKLGKHDPYKIFEFLQLTLEEAFFLSYGLGCLTVFLSEQKLSLSAMWSEFCQRSANFLRNYVAYHYYRSKGWVPHTGLKYGADLVLYKKGMPFFHSSFAVSTRLVDEKGDPFKTDENISCGEEWTWKHLISLNRLNEHVGKELLLCSITLPSGISSAEMNGPNLLRSCKVQEMILRRWIPKKNRER